MQLLQKKDWGHISIASLCRHAGIARSSFYEHFVAKADLLDELFTEQVGSIAISDHVGASLGTLDWLVNHASEVPGFFSHAMSGRRGDAIGPRFVAALIKRLELELAARATPDADVKAAYVIGGSIAYLLTGKDDKPCEKLQHWAARLLS